MTEQISLNYEKIVWTYEELDRASEDSFDFTTRDEDGAHIGLLLPAVQMAETDPEAVDDFTGAGEDDATQGYTLVELLEVRGRSRVDDADHDKWIDVLSIDWGAHKPGADTGGAGLRSDGELVQAVSDAEMGGDFIL